MGAREIAATLEKRAWFVFIWIKSQYLHQIISFDLQWILTKIIESVRDTHFE